MPWPRTAWPWALYRKCLFTGQLQQVCLVLQGGKTRVRQHVNPLCSQYQTPLGALPWHEIYADPSKPLIVDLGCGYGRFLLLLQRKQPEEYNYLGIEIRQKVRAGSAAMAAPSWCCS
jgi:tRNA G46 methylase TrmB